jgi:RNA polymerase sigma-70 factor (ECF subfamily)
MTEQKPMITPEFAKAREHFLELVSEVRPELHRYCARIVGSVVDGEDVVQDVLAKAFYAISMVTEVPSLRPWLFRVAHNTAVDFVRRYEKKHVEPRDDFDDVAAELDEAPDPEIVRAALSSFLALPVIQRSAVILKDVLGHSLEETASTMGTTVPAVKAALVRGRATLRAGRGEPAAPPHRRGASDTAQLEKLGRYAALFNARNWDSLRALMSEECRLDLVSRAERRGKEVGEYFARYEAAPYVRLDVGTAEGRPALLAFTSPDATRPAYFILLEWQGSRVSFIRDFRYVSYVTRDLPELPPLG